MLIRTKLPRLPGLAATLALGTATACGGDMAARDAATEVAVAEERVLEAKVEASGTLEPVRVVEVKSRASGEMRAILGETGREVEQGELLAEIDPRDVRSDVAETGADLEVARARFYTAQTQLGRMRQLRAADIVTEQEFESAVLEEANARAQVVKAQTAADLAQERMGDVTIRAPIAGTIIHREVEVGQIIVSASQNVSGGTTLFEMADLSRMQVETLVDETDIGRIRPGQPAEITVDAYPDRTFTGQVLKVEPRAVIEENVTMFPVLIRLDNREGLLKPGMTTDVRVRVERRDNTVAVPNEAVLSVREGMAAASALEIDPGAVAAAAASAGEGSALVFVDGPDGPEPRLVRTGLATWEHTEIRSGLEAGEAVLLLAGGATDAGQARTRGGLGRLFGRSGRSGGRR